jgi:transcriptional regulator with XRE-family HTH domain
MTDKKFLSDVGQRIREVRYKKAWTQQQLANKCNFQKASLSRIEAGKTNPTLLTLRKICMALKTDFSQLLP